MKFVLEEIMMQTIISKQIICEIDEHKIIKLKSRTRWSKIVTYVRTYVYAT